MISATVSHSQPVKSKIPYWRDLVDTTSNYMLWGLVAFAVSMLAYAFDLGIESTLTHLKLGIEIVAAVVAVKVFSGIYADFQSIRRRIDAASIKDRVPNIFVEIALSLAMAVLSPKFIDLMRTRRQHK